MQQLSTTQQIVHDNPESTRQYIVQDSPLSATAAGFVCWLVAQRPSNRLVYLRDGSAPTI